MIGSSHLATGIPCQDASLARRIGDDWLLLVAADGAGSAIHSDLGAFITCHSVATAVQQSIEAAEPIDTLTITGWLRATADQLRDEAAARGLAVRDLATTVLVALAGPRECHYVQVGDGVIITGRDGTYAPVTWPDNGEYANTTFFLTDDEAVERAQVILAQPPVDELVLLTDGLQALALQFADRAVHPPFCENFLAPLRAEPAGEAVRLRAPLVSILEGAPITQRTDDDKTLVLATRRVRAE